MFKWFKKKEEVNEFTETRKLIIEAQEKLTDMMGTNVKIREIRDKQNETTKLMQELLIELKELKEHRKKHVERTYVNFEILER